MGYQQWDSNLYFTQQFLWKDREQADEAQENQVKGLFPMHQSHINKETEFYSEAMSPRSQEHAFEFQAFMRTWRYLEQNSCPIFQLYHTDVS